MSTLPQQKTRINILIPTPLRRYTDGQSSVPVEGATAGEALNDLADRYPSLRKHLYDEAGTLRSFVNIYVNDEDIRYLEKERTPLGTDDMLSIVPSIAGGS